MSPKKRNTSTLPALFIGRFQPFHLGHLDALEQIFAKEKKVIIAIGSAQESDTKKNPFAAEKRHKMITATLKEKKIQRQRYVIVPVSDIGNDALWVAHVEKLVPKFHNVYTGSAIVKKLFKKDGKYPICKILKRLPISGTRVRAVRTRRTLIKLIPRAVAPFVQIGYNAAEQKQRNAAK